MNICLMTDSYKLTHWKQYPPGTQFVHSYLESRGGRYDETLFFGLQYYLLKYLNGRVLTSYSIQSAEEFASKHIGKGIFNRSGWEHILHEHNGYLPIRICAVKEGSVDRVSQPILTIENTDPQCFWLTNFIETLIMKIWYPITVASASMYCHRMLKRFAEETSDNNQFVDFQLHDFGYRGVSSEETAAIGGAAHLLNFKGTDTMAGIQFLHDWYGCQDMPAFSVPAAEHSTITSWGQEKELEAYANMLSQYPHGIISIVSDSYSISKAINMWCGPLRESVINRDGVTVIRPDSGEPTANILFILKEMEQAFGAKINLRGYKVLHPKIRIIQGDGITPSSLFDILMAVKNRGYSTENLVFGMGAGLLQKVDRDTMSFALKCSAVNINGQWHNVMKTSEGKFSKPGRHISEKLEVVFENGAIKRLCTFSSIKREVESAT